MKKTPTPWPVGPLSQRKGAPPAMRVSLGASTPRSLRLHFPARQRPRARPQGSKQGLQRNAPADFHSQLYVPLSRSPTAAGRAKLGARVTRQGSKVRTILVNSTRLPGTTHQPAPGMTHSFSGQDISLLLVLCWHVERKRLFRVLCPLLRENRTTT